MSDIEERLRNFNNYCELDEIDALKRDAADEIARLKAYVGEWKRRYETARLAHEEGRTKIERLQGALETCRELREYDAAEIERLRTKQQPTGKYEAGPDECDTGVALTQAIDDVLAEDAASDTDGAR